MGKDGRATLNDPHVEHWTSGHRRVQILAMETPQPKPTRLDPAEGLTSDEAVAGFMAEAFASEDAGSIAHALGVMARAKGMTQIAKDTGLLREQLDRSFSAEGNPTLKTTLAVMKALRIELTARVPVQFGIWYQVTVIPRNSRFSELQNIVRRHRSQP
jgi:probable addiction module antidote protein